LIWAKTPSLGVVFRFKKFGVASHDLGQKTHNQGKIKTHFGAVTIWGRSYLLQL